jgi:hypothetical protein
MRSSMDAPRTSALIQGRGRRGSTATNCPALTSSPAPAEPQPTMKDPSKGAYKLAGRRSPHIDIPVEV